MGWILTAGLLVLFVWLTQRARDRAAEHAAAGMLRSPLYLSTAMLTLTLLGIVLYMAHLQHSGPIPWTFWPLIAVMLLVILLLRRALKWRYPV